MEEIKMEMEKEIKLLKKQVSTLKKHEKELIKLISTYNKLVQRLLNLVMALSDRLSKLEKDKLSCRTAQNLLSLSIFPENLQFQNY